MSRSIAIVLVIAVAVCAAAAVPVHPQWKATKENTADLSKVIPLTITLRRSNTEKMDKIFWDVSNPESEQYGNHLNHEQMRKLVSPGPKAIAPVLSWIEAAGATDVKLSRHEDTVTLKATLRQVQSMLGVRFSTYEHKKSGRVIARALQVAELPSAVAAVVDTVTGFSGFPVERMPLKKTALKQNVGSPETSVTPELLYKAYNVTAWPETPAGQTNVQSFFQCQGQFVENTDLTTFCKQYMNGTGIANLTGKCHIDKYVGPNTPSEPGLESSLDSEYIMATGRATETWVYSYIGDDFCSDLLQWASDVFNDASGVFPHVISMSYGSQMIPNFCQGPDLKRLSEDVQKMGTMGISVMIASGDSGSAENSREGYNYGLLSPSFPAVIPYATSVGSTTFVRGNQGEEMASSAFGSGGGFSYQYAAPKYQQDAIATYFKTQKNLPPVLSYNATGRGTPDVSTLGEGFNVISGGQLNPGIDGTSCSTPTFSGFVTMLNNIRLKKGKTLGFLNPLLYANAKAFTDITKGSNDVSGDGMGWYSCAGWDPATGLGTPNFGKLTEVVEGLNARE